MKKEKDDLVHVRYSSGTYVARWRGKTASCTVGPEAAAFAVAHKVLNTNQGLGLLRLPSDSFDRSEFSVDFICPKPGELQGNQFDETIIDELSTQVPV